MLRRQCLVHMSVLVWIVFLTRIRDYHTLIALQLFVMMISVLLMTFLRLTHPIIPAQQSSSSSQNIIWPNKLRATNTTIKIGYTPKTEATVAIVQDIGKQLNTHLKYIAANLFSFRGFTSEYELIKSYCVNNSNTHMAIVFRDVANASNSYANTDMSICTRGVISNKWVNTDDTKVELPHLLEVVMRPSSYFAVSDFWHVDTAFAQSNPVCVRKTTDYTTMLLQLIVDAIIKHSSSSPLKYTLFTQPINCHRELIDSLEILRFAMPILVFVSYLPSALVVVREIIMEDNEHLTNTLRCIGVDALVYTASWVLIVVLEISLLAGTTTAVFFMPAGFSALPNSDPGIIFLFFVSYGLAFISHTAVLANFLSRDESAVPVIVFLNIMQILFVAYTIIYKEKKGEIENILYSFFTLFILNTGCNLIINYENTGEGVSWTNFFIPPSALGIMSIYMSIVILVLHISANSSISLVHLKMDYLQGAAADIFMAIQNKIRASSIKNHNGNQTINASINAEDENRFFEEDLHSKTFLHFDYELKRTSKQQGQNNGVRFKVYNTTITALLGYSQSDHLKVKSILSGHVRDVSVNVTVCGAPLNEYLKTSPTFTGFCLQQSSVFRCLSVKENIHMFSELKGRSSQISHSEVIAQYGLNGILHAKAGKLSAYWAFILKLVLAVLGEHQMLFIEDPMKTIAHVPSRMMLHVLKRLLTARTSVFWTMSADTAFYLADKVAVNIDEETVCFGSTDFVRYCFGVGYRLEMSLTAGWNADMLISYMQLFVPTLTVLDRSTYGLICILPTNFRNKFEFLFSNLHTKDKVLGIQSLQTHEIRMDDLLIQLKCKDTARAHLREIEKYRSTTDVFSLTTWPNSVLKPKLLYSAIVRTSSGRFSLLKIRSSQSVSLCKQSFSEINFQESVKGSQQSAASIFRNLRFMNTKKLPLRSTISTSVDQGNAT